MRRRRVGTAAAALLLASTGLGYVGVRHFHHPTVNWTWDLAAVDGNRLSIEIQHGACDHYRGYRIQEDQDRVIVAVRMQPRRTGYCTLNLLLQCEHIQLQQPLGTRQLLNAYVDPPVVVTAKRTPTDPAGFCGRHVVVLPN